MYTILKRVSVTGETTTDPETDRDRTITGCAQPDLNLGWSNNFQYKNWNLDYSLLVFLDKISTTPLQNNTLMFLL